MKGILLAGPAKSFRPGFIAFSPRFSRLCLGTTARTAFPAVRGLSFSAGFIDGNGEPCKEWLRFTRQKPGNEGKSLLQNKRSFPGSRALSPPRRRNAEMARRFRMVVFRSAKENVLLRGSRTPEL